MPKLLSNLSFLVDFINHKNKGLNNVTLGTFSFVLGVALCFVEDYVLLILSLNKSYHFPHFLPNGKIELYRSAFSFFSKKSFFLFIMDIFRHTQKWRDPMCRHLATSFISYGQPSFICISVSPPVLFIESSRHCASSTGITLGD